MPEWGIVFFFGQSSNTGKSKSAVHLLLANDQQKFTPKLNLWLFLPLPQ
jgi:hypothetical protein